MRTSLSGIDINPDVVRRCATSRYLHAAATADRPGGCRSGRRWLILEPGEARPRRQTMRVMVMVKATTDSEAGIMPSAALLEAMGKFNEELVSAGIMLAGEGLHPSSKGKRVAFDGASRTVLDGPFPQTSELVAGFWLWQVKDMDEAVAWARRCPNPMPGPSELEIRPLFELADFGDALTPELAEEEERLREKTQGS
jgi:hypothetical protein